MGEFNLYCDESCHIEHDHNDIMVIGGVWVPKSKRKEICERIKEIKLANGIKVTYELKWNNVSKLKKRAFVDLLNLFFDDDDLHFRGVIVHKKQQLDFSRFSGGYDEWYYKIYYTMISQLLSKDYRFNVYIDIKDSNHEEKINTLRKYIISRANASSTNFVLNNLQTIRSEEVEIMQLTDILIGALSYFSRDLNTSESKIELISLIKKKSGSSLKNNSYLRDDKFNILQWSPR